MNPSILGHTLLAYVKIFATWKTSNEVKKWNIRDETMKQRLTRETGKGRITQVSMQGSRKNEGKTKILQA